MEKKVEGTKLQLLGERWDMNSSELLLFNEQTLVCELKCLFRNLSSLRKVLNFFFQPDNVNME